MQKYSTAFENQLLRSCILQIEISRQMAKFAIYMVSVVPNTLLHFCGNFQRKF
jgi:hypothetical protein